MFCSTKVFNDPIHKSIKMPKYCELIIDTPEFQRLRFIKQLGCTSYVYPSAVHTRFEHSIGVSHLAGILARTLQENDPDEINNIDVACVEIAGLCHDLGHGPFSHAFEKIVPLDNEDTDKSEEGTDKPEEGTDKPEEGTDKPEEGTDKPEEGPDKPEEGTDKPEEGTDKPEEGTDKPEEGTDKPEEGKKEGKKWKHEDQSVIMFKYLIENNDLKKKLKKDHDIDDDKIDFICDIILGKPSDPKDRKNKLYLYQIVNNKPNGVDVDKWDYLARDTHYLGMNSPFDLHRIMPFVMVLDVTRKGKTRKELCFRDKVADDLNQMYLTRRRLHLLACQHRVDKIVTMMMMDAFKEAAEHIKFIGQHGKEYNLLESVKDPMAFTRVNDMVISDIMRSQEAGMGKAREILDRIHKRELYQCIGECLHANKVMESWKEEEIKELITDDADDRLGEIWHVWRKENIGVVVSQFDYGSSGGLKNPLLDIPFYKKASDGSFKAQLLPEDELPAHLPKRLKDVTVRIYIKVPNLDEKTLAHAKSICKDKLDQITNKDMLNKGTNTGDIDEAAGKHQPDEVTPRKRKTRGDKQTPTKKKAEGPPPAALEGTKRKLHYNQSE